MLGFLFLNDHCGTIITNGSPEMIVFLFPKSIYAQPGKVTYTCP